MESVKQLGPRSSLNSHVGFVFSLVASVFILLMKLCILKFRLFHLDWYDNFRSSTENFAKYSTIQRLGQNIILVIFYKRCDALFKYQEGHHEASIVSEHRLQPKFR